MRLLPRSAFGQTVFLIGFLLLINQLVSYVSVALYFIKPTTQQINHLIAKQIKVVFLDAGQNNPVLSAELTRRFSEATGIEVYTETEAMKQGLANARYYGYFS